MEHLDSKYFERVITALKEAKAQQKIEISDDFRKSLRVQLVEKATLSEDPETPNWADFVLKNRYVFGGVPVMAALVLVTMAALNHQIPVSNNQLISETPKTGAYNEKNELADREIPSSMEVSSEPAGIQTFSADLVMPPAYVLAQRERMFSGQSGIETNASGLQLQPTNATSSYTFLDKAGNQVQLNLPVMTVQIKPVEVEPVSEEMPIAIVPKQESIYIPAESNGKLADPKKSTPTTPIVPTVSVVPAETNGKVIVETVKTDAVVAPVIPAVVTPAIVTPPAVVTPTVVAPVIETGSQPVPAVLPSGQGTMVQTVTTEYLNTVELQTEVAPKVDFKYVLTAMPETQLLEAERIYFTGENREQLLPVVLDALKTRAGSLSRDYYVNIVKFRDGTYRATLYEYGKATRLLVIAEQKGGLKVITEVVY